MKKKGTLIIVVLLIGAFFFGMSLAGEPVVYEEDPIEKLYDEMGE